MATQLSGSIEVVAQGLMTSSSTQLHNLGELVHSNDGRAFRYCKAGGTALVAGKLQQAQAEDTGDQDIAATAAAIGDLSVTTAAMTVTANQYAQGLMIVTVTPGQGYAYKIKSHAAFTAAAATFTLEDAIVVALTTSSRLDFVANPYSAVIVNPATASSSPSGVAVYPVTASEYGWLQVAGVAAVLADGANAVGAAVVASNAVAGAVEDAAGSAQAIVGTCVTGGADTEYSAIKLALL